MKLTTNSITSRYGSVDGLNDNFDRIEQALENTLSRDGTSPNEMEADLDMNSNSILNAASVSTQQLVLNGVAVSASTSFAVAGFAVFAATATGGQTAVSVAPSILAATSLVMVYVNGIKLKQSETSFLGSTITVPALEAGDEVEVVEVKVG